MKIEAEIQTEGLSERQRLILQEEFNLCEELRNPSAEIREAFTRLCEDATYRFISGLDAPVFKDTLPQQK